MRFSHLVDIYFVLILLDAFFLFFWDVYLFYKMLKEQGSGFRSTLLSVSTT